MCDRTKYDQQMQEMYNPMVERYNKQPFPTPRTQADMELQKKWCPSCTKSESNLKEKFMHHNRSKFDQELQKKWCDHCNENKMENYSANHDWNNKFSYTHVPYRV